MSFIGDGAYATVYKVIDDKGNSFIEKNIHVLNFTVNELLILEKIRNKSPYLINLVDKEIDAPFIILKMEFVEDYHELFTYITSNPFKLTLDVKKKIMYHLLKGLKELHDLDIVHRDIKSENILINPATGTIKYIDFGLSAYKDFNYERQVGTPNYVAPEIYNKTIPLTFELLKKSDVWSLGLVFFILIFELDFWAINNFAKAAAMMKKITNEHIQKKINSWGRPDTIIFNSLLFDMLQIDHLNRKGVEQLIQDFEKIMQISVPILDLKPISYIKKNRQLRLFEYQQILKSNIKDIIKVKILTDLLIEQEDFFCSNHIKEHIRNFVKKELIKNEQFFFLVKFAKRFFSDDKELLKLAEQ